MSIITRRNKNSVWVTSILTSIFVLTFVVGPGLAKGGEVIPLKIGGGGMGGTFFPMMTSTMVVLNENIPGLVATVIPGSATANVKKLEAGNLDIGLSYLNWGYEAYNGTGAFDKKHNKLRAISAFPTKPFCYTVASRSTINSLKDLIGKKINVSRKGSGTETTIRRALEFAGITYDDITDAGGRVTYVGYGQAVTLMRDRAVDMAIFDHSPPDPNIMQIETAYPARVLNLSEDFVDRFIGKYPGYVTKVIPAGAYKGQKEGAYAIGWGPLLLASADLPDDLVYQMTKAIFENIDTLAKGFKGLSELSLDKAADGVKIPFHPGAERYLKEKGVLK